MPFSFSSFGGFCHFINIKLTIPNITPSPNPTTPQIAEADMIPTATPVTMPDKDIIATFLIFNFDS